MKTETRVTQVDSHIPPKRSFVAKRSLSAAFNFIQKKKESNECKMRRVQYGNDPRDIRYIVNYKH